MAKEVLAVPEENLVEVIRVIRIGLRYVVDGVGLSERTQENLRKWCDEEEAYLQQTGILSEHEEITFSLPQVPLPFTALGDAARNVQGAITALMLVGAANVLAESISEVNRQRGECVLCGASPRAPHADMCSLGHFLKIKYEDHFGKVVDDGSE